MEFLLEAQTNLAKSIKIAYENLTKSDPESITMGAIESRLKNLQENWNKFQANDIEINSIKKKRDINKPYFLENHYDAVEEEYLVQQGLFLDHKNSILEARNNIRHHQHTVSTENLHPSMPMHRKTPIIPVPKFNGNPAD